MNTRRFWFGLGLAVVVGGCAVGPNYRAPETQVPANWSGPTPAVATTQPGAPATQPAMPATQPANLATWWRALQDPTLDALVAQAVESNLDLRLATARVREARAQRDVTTAAFWPQVNVSSAYDYSGSSGNVGSAPKSAGQTLGGLLPNLSVTPGAVSGPGGIKVPAVVVNPQRIGPVPLAGSRSPSVSVQPGALTIPGGGVLRPRRSARRGPRPPRCRASSTSFRPASTQRGSSISSAACAGPSKPRRATSPPRKKSGAARS